MTPPASGPTTVRLSAAPLWAAQEEVYREAGPQAWLGEEAIPSYISNCALLARSYAETAVGFVRDAADAGQLDPAEPLVVVELGAGTGRFGYLLARELQRRLVAGRFAGWRLRYVLTDLGDRSAYWGEHPCLRPLVEQGVLDFARYDCTRDDSLTLLRSGGTLGPGSLANPVVAVANYVFDSIPHDLFRVRGDVLEEGRVEIPAGGLPPGEAGQIRFVPLGAGAAAYPDDPDLSAVPGEYREQLDDVAFLIPVSAVEAVRRLGALSGRLLLLVGDKGYCRTDQFALFGESPHLARHGPTLSVAVNFHALARYFERRGGTLLLPADPVVQFVAAAGVLGVPPGELPEIRAAYGDAVDGLPLVDHLPLLTNPLPESADLDHLLAILNVCHYDPEAILRHAEGFAGQARSADPATAARLARALERVRENFFPVGPEDARVPRRMGQLMFVAGLPQVALEYLQQALDLNETAQQAKTLFNMALCHRALGQVGEAERCLTEAARLDPSDSQIPALLSQLRAP